MIVPALRRLVTGFGHQYKAGTLKACKNLQSLVIFINLKLNKMNTEVNYEIAKLLAEKGFTQNNIDYGTISSIGKNDNNDLIFGETYACPNISQVVMWLYEKHGIWICVDIDEDNGNIICCARGKKATYVDDNFKSPTEAYLSAITHTLKNLI